MLFSCGSLDARAAFGKENIFSVLIGAIPRGVPPV